MIKHGILDLDWPKVGRVFTAEVPVTLVRLDIRQAARVYDL